LEIVGDNRVSPQMLALLHSGRAVLLARDGEHAAARAATRLAVGHGRSAFDGPMIAAALDDAAEAELLAGDAARALTLLTAAETIRGGIDRTRPWTPDVYDSAHAALGPDERATAVEQGRKATIENVLDSFPPP
jgi:hypothetical protein